MIFLLGMSLFLVFAVNWMQDSYSYKKRVKKHIEALEEAYKYFNTLIKELKEKADKND